jgi:hypothetical protein
MAGTILTRRVLYDLVWSKPMTKVSEELGLSDVGLKKVCTKHRVPTPPRGYWAKKDAGKPVKQTRLHETADPQDERIVIRGQQNQLPEPVRVVLEQERARRKPKAPPHASQESTPASDIHPSITGVVRTLRAAKIVAGVARTAGPSACGIEVGVGTVERVVVILDSLARELETRGLVLQPAQKCVTVSISPDSLSFSLRERIESAKHVPSLEELAAETRLREKRERAIQRGHWDSGPERAYPEFDHVRTGELTIQIADEYVGGLLRRTWRDGKRQRLETLVPDIAGGIVLYLAGVKARREEREARQREWKRQEALQALAKARAAREDRRLEFLGAYHSAATEAATVEASLARLRSAMTGDPPSEIVRFVAWTEARLRNLQTRMTPEALAAALRDKNIFPEIDDLVMATAERDEA